MSRNHNITAVITLTWMLAGCAAHREPALQPAATASAPVAPPVVRAETNRTVPTVATVADTSSPRMKIIEPESDTRQEREDALTLEGLDAVANGRPAIAKAKLIAAYNVRHSREPLAEAVKLGFSIRQTDDLIAPLESYADENPDDTEFGRMLASCYMIKRDFAKAKGVITQIISKKGTAADFMFAADAMQAMSDYERALKYYKQAYALKPSDQTLEKIGMLLSDKLDKADEAISYYETHIRIYGCSKPLCLRLSELYAQAGDVENVINVAKKLYAKYKETQVANRVVQLYLLQNNLEGLIDFLKKSKYDDMILFEAYKTKKDYPNASKTAYALYQKNKDVEYLGQAAIMKFESGDKDDRELVDETVKNLRIVIAKSDNDLYFNYLGYLLIDYNIDAAEGVALVKKAVEKDPDNTAYADSLAWGYYKIKKCKEAYELIIKVRNAMPNDKTVREHFDEIKKCFTKGIESNKTLRDIIK